MGKFIIGCILLALFVWIGAMVLSFGVGIIALLISAGHWIAQKIFKFS